VSLCISLDKHIYEHVIIHYTVRCLKKNVVDKCERSQYLGPYDKIEEMFKEINVANNESRVMFKGTMTKWPVQKQTHHETDTEAKRNRHFELNFGGIL